MVQDHRDRALSTRPSPYTHPIARASTGLALGVRSSTITGPAGGEGRRPNRQRTLCTSPSPYTHPIARASTGLALGVRSSTITGPAGGEGRRPNRQR
ncbi:unnamed protein product [Pylaiella littoralis]